MKRLLLYALVFIIPYFCKAQDFNCVKIYIVDSYLIRNECVKTQYKNMDYVRSHYSMYIYILEKNTIQTLYDSLMAISLKEISNDSINILFPSRHMSPDVYFEPCIVVDFISSNYLFENQYITTFSINNSGVVCRTAFGFGNTLYYPNPKIKSFLKEKLWGIVRF